MIESLPIGGLVLCAGTAGRRIDYLSANTTTLIKEPREEDLRSKFPVRLPAGW
jgi:hypothetical protein